jgi:hypothetical protein
VGAKSENLQLQAALVRKEEPTALYTETNREILAYNLLTPAALS